MDKRDFISFWEEARTIIDDAVEKRNRTVSVYYHPENGLSLHMTPWPDPNDLYDMYEKGQISENDFRAKLGLTAMKEPENYINRG